MTKPVCMLYHLTSCVTILMLSPFERLLKASFNCIQNKVEKPPGNVGVYGGEKNMLALV